MTNSADPDQLASKEGLRTYFGDTCRSRRFQRVPTHSGLTPAQKPKCNIQMDGWMDGQTGWM